MSGAAGLAAAKRRRGGAANSPGGPESRPSLARPPAAPQPGPPRIDILSIVTDHERRLRLIEATAPEDQAQAPAAANEVVSSVVDQPRSRDSEVEELRRQVEDLRALLSKVQTFAMETNTKLLRLQISRMSLADAGESDLTVNESEGQTNSADKPALVVTEKEVPKEEKAKSKKGNGKKIEE